MKNILIIGVCLSFFCCKTYQLTLEDLKEPFEFDETEGRIACHNKNGEKIWLYLKNGNFEVYKNGETKPYSIYMPSVIVKNDTLCADILKESSKKPIKVALTDISSAKVISISPTSVTYFDPDSIARIVKLKNDSLDHFCSIDARHSLFLRPINDSVPAYDSIILQENACYNLVFTDNTKINYGVIKKIKTDSIYITNYFDGKIAKKEKKDFKILHYPISEIKKLNLLKSDGHSFTTITNKQYHFEAIPHNKARFGCPSFYTWNKNTGEIYYYVNWLIESGYVPIKDIDGQIYW